MGTAIVFLVVVAAGAVGWLRLKGCRSALRASEGALEFALGFMLTLREAILDSWAVGANGSATCAFCGRSVLEPHHEDCIVPKLTSAVPIEEFVYRPGLRGSRTV